MIFYQFTVIGMKYSEVEALVKQVWEDVVQFSQGEVNRCPFVPMEHYQNI